MGPPSSPPKHLPQSGFLSSSLTLLGLLACLFGLWATALLSSRRSAIRRWAEVVDMERARLLQQPEVSQGSSVGARTRTPRVAYEWNAGGRAYLMFSSCLVFGVNVFSIVASVLEEPFFTEPKFFLIKLVSIPVVTITLFAQLILPPTSYAPPQINFTLILLLSLILIALAPIFTGLPIDTDAGRLALARRILEHVVGPSFVMGGLVAVHFAVNEVQEAGIDSQSSGSRSRSRGPEEGTEEGTGTDYGATS